MYHRKCAERSQNVTRISWRALDNFLWRNYTSAGGAPQIQTQSNESFKVLHEFFYLFFLAIQKKKKCSQRIAKKCCISQITLQNYNLHTLFFSFWFKAHILLVHSASLDNFLDPNCSLFGNIHLFPSGIDMVHQRLDSCRKGLVLLVHDQNVLFLQVLFL